jgi:hypothetical protein
MRNASVAHWKLFSFHFSRGRLPEAVASKPFSFYFSRGRPSEAADSEPFSFYFSRGRPSEAAASEPFPFYFSRGRPPEAAASKPFSFCFSRGLPFEAATLRLSCASRNSRPQPCFVMSAASSGTAPPWCTNLAMGAQRARAWGWRKFNEVRDSDGKEHSKLEQASALQS